MGNQERAVEVIMHHIFADCPNCLKTLGPCADCEDAATGAAKALADAGLLAPDLPEPQDHNRETVWPVEEPEGWSVSLRDGWMRLCDNYGMIFAVDILTARDLGYALLAATSTGDGHQ